MGRQQENRNLRTAIKRNKKVKHRKRKTTHCKICNGPFKTHAEKTIDHIVPLSKGGANKPYNIQIVCLPCNALKADN